MVCKDVADWPDPSLVDTRRGDLSLFFTMSEDDEEISDYWEDDQFEPGPSCHRARKKHAARNRFAFVAVPAEVKLDKNGFGATSKDPLLPDNDDARQTRGQICDYAAEIILRQHRIHLFVVYVYRTTARIIRFDSAGAVITHPIDLKQQLEKFFEFFWRLRKASDVKVGLDPTATMVFREPNEDHPDLKVLDDAISEKAIAKLAKTQPRTAKYIAAAFRGTLWPIYKLEVPDKEDPTKKHHLLVRNLSTQYVAISGRLTTGYIALHLESKTFCFLKDYWRPDSPRITPE